MYILTQEFKTEYGELIIASYDEKLVLCDWKYRKMRKAVDDRIQKGLNATLKQGQSNIIEETKHQLGEYFTKKRTIFDLNILLVGTDFQKSVWNQLICIPYGTKESYLSLSRKLGNELAIRAVASANGANALSIIVPCHRVVGSNGELTGYAGGLASKKKLLTLESGIKEPIQLTLSF